MVKFYPSLSDHLSEWCMTQPIFYIASSPLYGSHINISPKGLPSTTFSILGPNTAAYIDATGSGAETIAHLYENGRCTVMFCSFEQAPRILRLFCRGKVVEFWEEGFGELTTRMAKEVPVGARAVILLDIFKVQTSCGYGVPLLSTTTTSHLPPSQPTHLIDRETLGHWANKTVSESRMTAYRALNNAYSLDCLPGLKSARRTRGHAIWKSEVYAWFVRLWVGQKSGMLVGVLGAWLMGVLFVRVLGVDVRGVFLSG